MTEHCKFTILEAGKFDGDCNVYKCRKSTDDWREEGEKFPIVRMEFQRGRNITQGLEFCYEHFKDLILEGVIALNKFAKEKPIERKAKCDN